MQAIWDQILESLKTYAPSIIGAIVILIVGWFVAKIISSVVRRGLGRTKLGQKMTHWLGGQEAAKSIQVERRIAKIVYYLVMLLVLVAMFQVLNLTIATEPVNNLLNTVFRYIPNIVGAGVLLLVAWILATILKVVITRVMSGAQIDERFGDRAGIEAEKPVSLSKMLGEVVYWLVFLFFLPAILGALKLQGLLAPVQSMTDKALSFVPNLFIAAIILLVGWFVARIVRLIVTNVLAASGTDGLSERIGLAGVMGEKKLSGFLGTLLYVLILIPVLIASLNALGIEAITQPTSNMLNVIVTAIPNIFAAAIVVIVAYLVSRIVAGMITSLLTGFGFNSIMAKLGIGKEPVEGRKTPSEVVGHLAMAVIILAAVTAAFHLLGFVVLTEMMASFLVFAGHVALGLIILAFGLYLASLLSRAVASSSTPQAGLLAVITRVAVLLLSSAIALRQMGFANEIVNMAFGLLLGAVALATAIAFGVGGRDFAARKLDQWTKPEETRDI